MLFSGGLILEPVKILTTLRIGGLMLDAFKFEHSDKFVFRLGGLLSKVLKGKILTMLFTGWALVRDSLKTLLTVWPSL
jgi:hypothetical protein